MTTVLVPPGSAREGLMCRLDDEESHHVLVRRASDGDVVEIRDGAGLVGAGRLRKQGKTWGVEIETVRVGPVPPTLQIAIGAGDRERYAWAVEKLAELGATIVVPLETERTAGVATKIRSQHLAKLRRQALETLKQSGAAWAPRIDEPAELGAFLSAPAAEVRWLADAEGSAPTVAIDSESASVVIGPEGGFTASERGAILAAGYDPVRLGQHTLRFETAAVAAAAAVNAARFRGSHG